MGSIEEFEESLIEEPIDEVLEKDLQEICKKYDIDFETARTLYLYAKKNKDGELDVGQFPDNLIVKHWDKHF